MPERPTIFFAEDSPADCYLFREALKAHNIEAELLIFHDGEEAMAFLTAVEEVGPQPQLFVIDLNLPKVDGFQLLQYLRGSARFSHAVAIILTSSTNPADRVESMRLGATRYIRKADSVADFLEIGREIKSLLLKTSEPLRACQPVTTRE